ncbi:arrestin domain-containing protein 1 isoform X2 [Diabrotica virgifera virgifera]|uniref:Arrestin C-terminal-like domain-containing protein n=1 Tax=Diabrotica virgifera virgifera TaxID=50390 RepID=A0ABM5JTN8_DIAVI|nr:arrestin domain-containing protein 1 isoform X2 [Diabrotica virgifera virgifera]
MSCQIVLSNTGPYSPGDTIYGKVVCNFRSSERFRGIICKLRGRECTSWNERQSHYDTRTKRTKWRTVKYTGDNKFLALNINLMGESTLPAGCYEYPFTFTLPQPGIPSTFTNIYGYVTYYIKANVDKAFAIDYIDTVGLHVIAPVNFNYMRHELQLNPITYQDETTMCCLCSGNGVITMNLYLDKEAYVAGEIANIKVIVYNMSNENFSDLILSLKRHTEYTTTSPNTHHKHETDIIAHASDTGVGAHGERTYNLNFMIPATAPINNFSGCSLFKQWFVLKVKGVIKGFHANLEISANLKLGHIPFLGNSVGLPPAPSMPYYEPGKHSGEAPPSYEESIKPSAPS